RLVATDLTRRIAVTRTWTPEVADDALTTIAATPRLVVALDFDGTASPLVPEPMAARALPEVKAQLDRLAALPDTVIVDGAGRSMHGRQAITEHTPDSVVGLAGSHGAQYWFPGVGDVDTGGESTEGESREELWAAAQPIVDRYEGVVLEPKTFGMG